MSEVGYRKPPASTRFAKGASGNPNGRPRGRHRRPPYDEVLGQKVLIRDGDGERRVTAAEAFLLYLTKCALEGDTDAARAAAEVIEQARASRTAANEITSFRFDIGFVDVGTVNTALECLRMAAKLDRYRPSARMALEPWLVQAALARLGNRRLNVAEQTTIVAATRTPRKVAWPEWWSVVPR